MLFPNHFFMSWSLARVLFQRLHIWVNPSIYIHKANCPQRNPLPRGGERLGAFRICAHTFPPASSHCQRAEKTSDALQRRSCSAGRRVTLQPFHCHHFCWGPASAGKQRLQGMVSAFLCFLQCGILELGDGREPGFEAGDLRPFPLVCFHSGVRYFEFPTGMVSTSVKIPTETFLQIKVPHFCLRGDKILLLYSQKMAAFISALSPAVPCCCAADRRLAMPQHSCLQLVSTNSSVVPRPCHPPCPVLVSAFCNSAGHPGFNQGFDENDGAQAIIQGVFRWRVWPWKSKCQHKR